MLNFCISCENAGTEAKVASPDTQPSETHDAATEMSRSRAKEPSRKAKAPDEKDILWGCEAEAPTPRSFPDAPLNPLSDIASSALSTRSKFKSDEMALTVADEFAARASSDSFGRDRPALRKSSEGSRKQSKEDPKMKGESSRRASKEEPSNGRSPSPSGPEMSRGGSKNDLKPELLKPVSTQGLQIGKLENLANSEAFFLRSQFGLCGISRRSRLSNQLQAIVEPEFEQKAIEHSGGKGENPRSGLSLSGIAASCRKARKISDVPNQDNFFVVHSEAFTVCCIADGHGQDGHWASHWAARFMLLLLQEELDQKKALPSDNQMWRLFDRVQKELLCTGQSQKFDLFLSGTTLSVVVIDRKQQLLLASWVGDSRCIVGRGIKSDALDRADPAGLPVKIVGSTADHKPSDTYEQSRILSRGGEVVQLRENACFRVFGKGLDVPGLAMSRAIGDLAGHNVGVVHLPSFLRVGFQPDDVVLCCSDGVWEFIENEEALDLILRTGRKEVGHAVDVLVREAWSRWLDQTEDQITDDITAVAMWL